MNTFKKIVFWTALVYLGFWILFPIIRMIVHIEFISDEIKSEYLHFQYYAVSIAILLTLVGTIDLKLRVRENLIILIVTIGFGVIIHFISVISLFMNMCTHIDKEVLFQHKENPNKQIIFREMDCGAVDSSEQVPQIFEVNYFSSYFKTAYKIDTTKINQAEWISTSNPTP